MPTENSQLLATLQQLRDQLSTAANVDPKVRDELHAALFDIQSKLATGTSSNTAPADSENASLTGRLTLAARHFEESHPTLSSNLGSIIDTLARMGI